MAIQSSAAHAARRSDHRLAPAPATPASGAPVSGAAPRAETGTQWPHDLSQKPQFRIGEVRRLLAAEFPMLSVSKIRHYESIDLLHPHRTATNQRLFSQSDVERLRFILREQRDRYLPLDQIREELRQLDAGLIEHHPQKMHAVADNETRRPQPGERLTASQVVNITGTDVATVDALVDAGILQTDARGRLSAQAPEIVRYSVLLLEAGFDLHSIKTIRTSARSHAHTVLAQLGPQLAKKTPAARERAIARTDDATQKICHLYRALLTENIEVELR
ncbi:DNA-binding transcriptional regulator, MerR family [Actinobaculum suis]|uniref:DNA-binding transcriptional regulator, MerR family n=1 Tax=Actinobaculum suis TaxID=1657 RepID=A0A1G7C099_9ACTO|nr:MerR family transcriptional regulator [Actinobaculum suis]MDY5153112.1 MerR family transcriptional regulator [Actinobaculum suis]SDE32751.1 DNA-binding transcriptional regulator, MerR family [Actinobaculum suis]